MGNVIEKSMKIISIAFLLGFVIERILKVSKVLNFRMDLLVIIHSGSIDLAILRQDLSLHVASILYAISFYIAMMLYCETRPPPLHNMNDFNSKKATKRIRFCIRSAVNFCLVL